jgi:type IV secretory pathway TrbF-like protein
MSTSAKLAWPPDPKPDSKYVRARQEWDERMGGALVHARNWRLAAFAALGTVFLAVAGMIYLGRLPKLVPLVVEVDHMGAATYLGPVGQSDYVPSDAVVRYHLQQFLERTRSISSDPAILKRNWFDTYSAVTPKGAAMLTAYVSAPEHNPMRRAQDGQTVAIETASIVRVSQDTWQVDWRETTSDRHGTPVGPPALWRGMFKILLQKPDSSEATAKNPIGLYVDEFHWDTVAQ